MSIPQCNKYVVLNAESYNISFCFQNIMRLFKKKCTVKCTVIKNQIVIKLKYTFIQLHL